MINENNSNLMQLSPSKKKSSNSVMELSLPKKKIKTENTDTSNTKASQSDKSTTNKSLSALDLKAEMHHIQKEIPKSPNKLTRNKTVGVGESKKKIELSSKRILSPL